MVVATQTKAYYTQLNIRFTCYAGYESQPCQYAPKNENRERVRKLHTGGVNEPMSDIKRGKMNELASNNQVINLQQCKGRGSLEGKAGQYLLDCTPVEVQHPLKVCQEVLDGL